MTHLAVIIFQIVLKIFTIQSSHSKIFDHRAWSYICYIRNVTFLSLKDLLVLCKDQKDPL